MSPWRDQQSFALAACVAFAFAGCKKDKDTTAPTVTILTPAGAASVQVPGNLTVVAQVSDDRIVEAATIGLSDAQGIAILPSITVPVGSASATIQRTLEITSELITSCQCELSVRASDGANDGRDFRAVNVIEAPLRLRALLAVSTPSSSSIQVHRIDSAGNVSLFASFAQDLQDAAIRSRDGRLVLAGAIDGPLLAVNTTTAQVDWQIANLNTLPIPWFTGTDIAADGRLYVSTNDGFLRVFNTASGGQQFSTTAGAGHRAYLTHVQDDLILSEQAAIAGGQRKLVLYSAFNGTPVDEQSLDKDLVAMQAWNTDEVLLFGNRDGDGVIEQRVIPTAGSADLMTFAGEEIRRVASISSDVYAVALPGRIVRYTRSANAATDLATLGADDLAHDPASGILWVADGNLVLGLHPVNGTVVESHAVPQPVDHLLALFNR